MEMDNIEKFVLTALAKNGIKGKFLKRIKAGSLFRSDNPEDHFCVFFCAFDPNRKLLFLGKHLKSGLWLVNGGHMEKGESFDETFLREAYEEFGIKMLINDCSKVHLLTISDI